MNFTGTRWTVNVEPELSGLSCFNSAGLFKCSGVLFYGIRAASGDLLYDDASGIGYSALASDDSTWTQEYMIDNVTIRDRDWATIEFVNEPTNGANDLETWLLGNAVQLEPVRMIATDFELTDIASVIRGKRPGGAAGKNLLKQFTDEWWVAAVEPGETYTLSGLFTVPVGCTHYTAFCYILSDSRKTYDSSHEVYPWLDYSGSSGQVRLEAQLTVPSGKHYLHFLKSESDAVGEEFQVENNDSFTSYVPYTEQILYPDGFVDGIKAIETGVDTSDATAIAADILLGKTAYVDGSKVTGSLDMSDATATAGDIVKGKTAYVSGSKLTGTYVPKIEVFDNNGFSMDVNITIARGSKVQGQPLTSELTLPDNIFIPNTINFNSYRMHAVLYAQKSSQSPVFDPEYVEIVPVQSSSVLQKYTKYVLKAVTSFNVSVARTVRYIEIFPYGTYPEPVCIVLL